MSGSAGGISPIRTGSTSRPLSKRRTCASCQRLSAPGNASPRHSRMASTGGSTGEPVRLLHDTRVPVSTISWRLFDWWGVGAADNVAHVYRHVRSPGRVLLHRIQWWPSRSIQIDAYRMDDRALRRFLEGWNRVSLALILGDFGGISAGEGLTAIFDNWPESVKAFQVIQHRNAHISLRCVRGADPKADSIMEHVRCDVVAMTNGKVPVTLEVVDHIPHDGGKTRYIVSEFGSY